jgi:propionyl-CoA synthetase
MATYRDFYQRSIADPSGFWAEQARLVDWHKPFATVLEYDKPPFRSWFKGGEINLCHNAVDRHVAKRGAQPALVWISTEVGETRAFTYAELHDEVNRFAAILRELGVGRGDRVLIYMPMTPEAVFAMLATVRLGAIHSVVFGGFAAASLAARIDDAKPKVMVTSDAGMRMGKVVTLKPLADESIRLSSHPPKHVLLVDRGLQRMDRVAGRDVDYSAAREKHKDAKVPCAWLESNEPSYILYTSGTTGQPKGVQRDTGGYAVALAASMKHIFCSQPGEAYFSTSDIGWVVGHSYIVYAPLINGSTTIMYEGVPMRPDAGIWWKIVQDYKVTSMFTSPTAIRVLKKHDTSFMARYDTRSLKYLFLAGEPLDEPTARWVAQALPNVAIVDNYWQTETGWPILTACPGVEDTPRKFGSPSFAAYGYRVKLKHEETGREVGTDEKGVLCIVPPLPPGSMTTIWGDDKRYVETYYKSFADEMVYTTFDWATRDKDGYYFVLGRTDDVINVAGHRLGTREIEEAVQAHPNVAEVAVVGVADSVKGQVPIAFAVLKDPSRASEKEIMATVDRELGAIARPARVCFVTVLPKTRSGKLLRRSIQAICEGRDPGDLTTIEDPGALEQIRSAVKPSADAAKIS